ncbi:MAG: septum formation initiator family protein [bacterium]
MKKKSSRTKYLVIAGSILLIMVLVIHTGFKKVYRHSKEIKKIDGLIAGLKADNVRLEEQIDLAKNDLSYIERLARKELGLIQPGEIEYRFIDLMEDKPANEH